MKSKIVALSKNEEFKSLLKKKKISNKYVTIFFGKLPHKDNKKLNISFSVKKKIGSAVKIISINFDFSILVLAKESMLNNEYKNIKETLFQDLEKIK